MDSFDLFQRLSVALAVGLLIGLERGWRARDEDQGERTAGLRTFALSGLLGGIWGAIAKATADSGGAVALGIAFVIYAAIFAAFRYREICSEGTYGATTIVAAMLTFALGAFAVLGPVEAAAAAGVVAAALLAWKSLLHRWLEKITREEIRSALILLAMTFVLLPLLPHRTIDPWDSINPYELWLMTIMIAALSFAGYIAVRLAGEKQGIAITGVAGGLASSTAVTMTLSRLAREHPEQSKLLASGALFASAVMAARVLAIVGAINPRLLASVGPSVGAVGAVLAVGALILMWRGGERGEGEGMELKNPFELGTVLKFGLILAVVMFAAKALTDVLGSAGTYAVAALSGVADTAAITLSMARSGSAETATIAIFIAVVVNTVVKSAMAWWVGGAAMGWLKAVVSVLAIAAGLAGLMLTAGWRDVST